MTGFYSNPSARTSSESMANPTNYDVDSFLDFSGGYSTPTTRPGSQGTSTNAVPSSTSSTPSLSTAAHLALPSTFAGPSFSYDSFPQQTPSLPYNMSYPAMSGSGMSSSSGSVGKTSGASSPKSNGMDVDDFSTSFLFPESDYADPSMNFNFNDSEVDMDLLAGIKQERSTSNASMSSTGSSNYTRPQPARKVVPSTDAATEERIRQILEDVKRRALASNADDDDGDSPTPQLSRMKKDEEDMDEDERLLASEEGKKLTSKERRQLRNKVSARAFRSRRKEYIGQLEGEVAAKANESSELRERLRAVEAENESLKDLTHMLLASPQFSSFLDQLHPMTASNGLNLASLTAMNAPSRSENVAVHRVHVPEVHIQAPMPQQAVDFSIPTYIPPHQQYINTYNPHKDINPVQNGVEDWPLAYPTGPWGGSSAVFAAEVPMDNFDANEFAGKSLLDSLSPADGFRPGFFSPIKSDKEIAEPDYSNSFDKNGQFIFDVYEDELEDVPEYLYDHFEIHAPLSEQKMAEAPLPKVVDVLPTLGLTKLFSELESMITEPEVTVIESSLPPATISCRDSELFNTIESVERLHRRVGVFCGIGN